MAQTPISVCYCFLDLEDGGAQRLTLETCKNLNSMHFSARLLCVRGGGRLVGRARALGLQVDELRALRRPFDLFSVLRIQRFFRESRVRIVQTPLYSRVSPYVRLAARLASVPLVVAHEFGRPEESSALRKLADRLLRGRTLFVAASRHHGHELRKQGVTAEHVEVVYSGIDIERFAPRDGAFCRERLGLPQDRPLVLIPARLHPMKGHGVLLDAVPDVIRRVPGALFLCAGEGPLRGFLESEVEKRGLGETVRFLGLRGDIPDLLGASDAVALPSLREGLPSAMLEAFAAARPVVATDVGGVAEALTDEQEGRLVPPGRPGLLAQALTEILEDPVRRGEMGKNGQETVKAFTAVRSTRHLESLYLRWMA